MLKIIGGGEIVRNMCNIFRVGPILEGMVLKEQTNSFMGGLGSGIHSYLGTYRH